MLPSFSYLTEHTGSRGTIKNFPQGLLVTELEVVLPMVGHSIKYPRNKVGQWYRERLSKDELELCKFRVSPLQLNIPGCYRLILKNIQNLSYFLEGSEKGIKIEDKHLKDLKVSLHMSFDLDPSCYATVCLREIMKCDF